MIWVTWRQHRWEALWTLVATGLLAATIGLVRYELQRANCSGPGQSLGLPDDTAGSIASALAQLNL